MATLEELKQLQNGLVEEDQKIKGQVGFGSGVTRAAAQGLTFGFADEIEAKYMSMIKGTSYKDEVNKIRNDISKFREQNPVAAYGTEILASIPTSLVGGAGIARAAQIGSKAIGASKAATTASKAGSTLGQLTTRPRTASGAAAIGATEGAIYGAGAGEGVEGKLIGAGVGSVAGGALSGAATLILPRSTQEAIKLIRKGIPVTPGASKSGGSILGNLIGGIEQSSTSIPGLGAAISQAKTKAISDFNKVAIKEALEPILDKAGKKTLNKKIANLAGTEAYDEAASIVSNEYTKVLSKMKLAGEGLETLEKNIVNIIENATLNADQKSIVIKRITKNITNQIQVGKDGQRFLPGNALKKIEIDLFDDIKRFKRTTGSDSYIGDAFQEIRNNFKSVITEFNPNNKLGNVNLAFAQLKPIEAAVLSAYKTKGIFSTGQFLQGIKKVDRSFNKSATARGKNLMLNLAREGDEVLGNFMPDSGTASRLIAGEGAVNPSTLLSYAPAAIAGGLGYAPGAMNLIRYGIDVPGIAARRLAPFVGSQAMNMPGLITNNNN